MPLESSPDTLIEWSRESGQVQPLLEMMQAKLRQRRQRRRKAAASVAAGCLAVLGLVWAVPFVRQTDTLGTQAAQRQVVALGDGSTAELNARTKLKTDFRYGRRTVRLTQGEAFFAVAKDTAHPFLVEIPAGTVRVTGTAFNVRLVEGDAVVTLVEGAVDFAARAGGVRVSLRPSEQVTARGAGVGKVALSAEEMENALAWRTGFLVLEGKTLAEVAASFAAYHDKHISVDASVAGVALGGSCPLDDLPGFLDFVRDSARVQVLKNADGSYRIRAR